MGGTGWRERQVRKVADPTVTMQQDIAIERLFQSLIAGDRTGARQLVSEYLASGHRSEEFAIDVLWPSMQTLFQMWRSDQLSTLAHRYATRLMRTIVDQVQASYAQAPRNGRRILLACGADETEDMAAQLAADFLESAGYEVLFAASGVANDELLAETGTRRPDALVMFAAGAADAPRIRQLIDTIHAIRATPGMPILCGGGVFNRAPGLAEEIGADGVATDPVSLVQLADETLGLRKGSVTAKSGSAGSYKIGERTEARIVRRARAAIA
jgi:methanogenic corrinoid protein MtbC1